MKRLRAGLPNLQSDESCCLIYFGQVPAPESWQSLPVSGAESFRRSVRFFSLPFSRRGVVIYLTWTNLLNFYSGTP
ncbi:Uncharacterised protein [Pannonibacter phragmitetus]|uniref:Uncharacterized protein n=1 Tax=Pannonibacter phragmitetus TaxID=121719 RepID=A0A378ZTP4_9HYPH|nr:Uncharacterised protein [Pannonibacter phragmitetus]